MYMLLVNIGKTIILTGIYMQGVICHSALGYGSPLSFGAGSVLPISRFTSAQCQRILTSSWQFQVTLHMPNLPPFCTLSHLRTLWFSLHLHFQWNWMTELNRLNFLQWRKYLGEKGRKETFNCVSLQKVVVVVSSFFFLPHPSWK